MLHLLHPHNEVKLQINTHNSPNSILVHVSELLMDLSTSLLLVILSDVSALHGVLSKELGCCNRVMSYFRVTNSRPYSSQSTAKSTRRQRFQPSLGSQTTSDWSLWIQIRSLMVPNDQKKMYFYVSTPLSRLVYLAKR